jgi:hypothetical protein
LGVVVHACNPSYTGGLGGGLQFDASLEQKLEKLPEKKQKQKIGLGVTPEAPAHPCLLRHYSQ